MEENEKLLVETVHRAKSNQRRVEELEKRVEEHHGLGIPVKLEGLEERVGKVERMVEEIHELSRSVDSLARSVQEMLREQQGQRKEIEALKGEPGERWKSVKRTALTAVVSTVAGALAVGLVLLVANFIK